MPLAHCNFHLPGSSNPTGSASLVGETTDARHHTQLIFVFLVEMGFHHVGQTDFELLTYGDPSISASQSYRHDPLRPVLILVFLVETGFRHVGQAGLEFHLRQSHLSLPKC